MYCDWGDVDLKVGKMRVICQLQRVRGGAGLVFSPTKHSNRSNICLMGTAVETLRKHRARQAEK